MWIKLNNLIPAYANIIFEFSNKKQITRDENIKQYTYKKLIISS